jgi:hypothetical protein
MSPLLESIRTTMSGPRGGGPVCIVCGRSVAARDDRMRLRGGTVVHRGCATYEMRRRPVGADRLGYPRSR